MIAQPRHAARATWRDLGSGFIRCPSTAAAAAKAMGYLVFSD
jgi:hypothetical protein